MMLIKTSLVAAALIPAAFSRMLLIERDGRPFWPRRFGQEQCGGLGGELGSACAGGICGTLGGRVPGSLLAGADPCAQQDLADDIINASKDQDAATAAKMVDIAIRLRQCEKNTPPDFSTNPPTLRNSVFCLKAPQNQELDGLVQAQDPANDPDLFFDPITKATVVKGAQANTFPFGQGPDDEVVDDAPPAEEPEPSADPTDNCPAVKTVTVTAGPAATATATVAAVSTPTADFGQCGVPEIAFDIFDGRSQNSFAPVGNDFQHGSALNSAIITSFICNSLASRCNANQVAIDDCKAAIDATNGLSGQAVADAFNSVVSRNA